MVKSLKFKNNLLIILIVILGLILRFYKLSQNLYFSGEFGDNLLVMKNLALSGKLPLIGPPTSHPWLYFGPLYYWIVIPIESAFRWDPHVGVYVGALIGVLVIVINYFVVSNLFDKRIAQLSSLLIAISPLWIQFSRIGRFYFFVTPLFYIFFWALIKFVRKDKYLWLVFFSLGVMFSFHYSPLILFPAVAFCIFFKRKRITRQSLFNSLAAFLLPLSTLIIYDASNNFEMIIKFVAWVPYRVAGFLGLVTKNNTSAEVLSQDTSTLVHFLGFSFTLESSLDILIALIIIVAIYYSIKLSIQKRYKVPEILTLNLMLLTAFVAFVVHGDAPIHYFLPVFSVPIILLSYVLTQKKFSLKLNIASLMFFLVLVLININQSQRSRFFYAKDDNLSSEISVIFYNQIDRIVKVILADANGKQFSLVRVGEGDNFDGYYAQNYQYLMWFEGNEPVKNSKLIYTIYEEIPPVTLNGKEIFNSGGIVVTRVDQNE